MSDYKVIETEDGSSTVYSPLYDESCHSTFGAIAETKLHYIEGCKIAKRERPVILEVGFGTGLGFIETSRSKTDYFTFISLEIDSNMIEIAKNNYQELKGLKLSNSVYTLKTKNFELIILLGDARFTLSKFINENSYQINCIYQDAFSPKRNSTLWTYEWFKLLKDNSHEDCIMSTYSSSSSIRKSMIAAGWLLYPGESFGPKRASTRARLSGETHQDIIDKLDRSPVEMLTDFNAKDYTL